MAAWAGSAVRHREMPEHPIDEALRRGDSSDFFACTESDRVMTRGVQDEQA